MFRNFQFILIAILLWSCDRNDTKTEVVPASALIVGNWKLVGYEYKGKNLIASACEKQSSIMIGETLAGSYDRYLNNNSGCQHPMSFAGNWTKTSDNLLIIKYTESGIVKTTTFNLESVSSTELRILLKDADLDGNGTIDEGIGIYTK